MRQAGSAMGRDEPASSASGSISSTLLDQLRTGRPEAWQRLVLLYSPVIYRWCRRSGVTAEDAADVLQEVLAAVMRYLPAFRRERPGDSFTAWLAAITRSKIHDHYRHRSLGEARGGSTAQRQMAELPQPPEPPQQTISADAAAAACLSRQVLNTVRSEFEARTWEAFWRVTVERQPPAVVAEDLQMSPAAVYMAKSRVLRRLRQALAELPE